MRFVELDADPFLFLTGQKQRRNSGLFRGRKEEAKETET